jgi:catalase (peroxidase I)
MKFNLLTIAAALAGTTEAFLSAPRQQKPSSSALNNYSTVKWSPSGAATTTFAPSQSSFSSAGPATTPSGCPFHANYDAIREEIKLLLDNPSWDDGSLAPIFIRLAWHSSVSRSKY